MKILINNQGKAIISSNKAFAVEGTSPDPVIVTPTYNGTVDTVGLTALGWDEYDIQWLQDHVWWNEEDNDYWKVTEANLAFGPNGSTPLTWADRATIKNNPDVRYFPKFIQAPVSNTSWVSLFYYYTNLYAIPTHGWDSTNVTNFSGMFSYCYNLRSVGDLSNWNTNKVTNISSMFNWCTSLISPGDLTNWNTSNVTTFSSLFYACWNLTNIGDLSNWNTSKLTGLNAVFYNCKNLVHIGDLSNWDVSRVTNLSYLFQSCCGITSVGKLKNWNTSNVTNMASMFNGCYSLQTLDVTSWNTSKVTNMSGIFAYCYALSSLGDVSNWDVSNATSLGLTFYCCYNLSHIGDVSNWDTSNVTNMSYTFGGCPKVKSIGKLDNWNTSKVTTFLRMFYNSSLLQDIGDLSNWDTSNATSLEGIFGLCVNMKFKGINSWDVSKVTIFAQTFYSIILNEIDISNWDLSSATNTGTSSDNSITGNTQRVQVFKIGPKFFNGTPTTYYFQNLQSWTRESIVESLYTNQTLRNSNSTAITVKLNASAYDRLTAEDRANITSKNITLTRG